MKKLFALTAMLLAMWASASRAETTNCTPVTSAVFNISSSGIYCLTSNLTTGKSGGIAIRISANNVVLDLNGFRLRGVAGPGSTASGIYASNRQNVTIRNGTIEGFYRCIWVDENGGTSSGHLIEDIRTVGCYFAGIQAEGTEVVVRNNRVIRTGDGSFTSANGIFIQSFQSVRVSGNTVADTSESATARGIFAITGSELVVEDNVVTDTHTATAKYGIHVQSVNRATVIRNQLLNFISGTTGIRTVSSTGVSCFDNVIDAFTNQHSTCDNVSNNRP